MHIKRAVGEKGQVVVPKDIREHLGLRPGTNVIFEVTGKDVVIKAEKDPKDFVEDFCNVVPKSKRKKLGIKKIKQLLDEQYEEELIR
ncbi:MAG: AbrB/MazE/SpoVT family DNA-binding domain-containing protein [Candidatus Aenigmarchaeota archaeon]|nr:AbrB/MazE/SpoVT family DNA-binding domain-containing protein [Candidatus Aenigmarchaeota archaeon]